MSHIACKMTSTIKLVKVSRDNVNLLRHINRIILPVTLKDKLYNDILESDKDLAMLAYSDDTLVGAVSCQFKSKMKELQIIQGPNDPGSLYIVSLGCLALYRRQKVGTALMKHVIRLAEDEGLTCPFIFLHVQVNNEAAIDFYKKFGFEIVERIENFYRRYDPPDAYCLRKDLLKA